MNDLLTPKVMSCEDFVLMLRHSSEHVDLVKHCYFDDPIVQAAQRFKASTEWQQVRQMLHPPKENRDTVLDVGAGRGIATYAFVTEGWKVTALEPDPSRVVGAGALRMLKKEGSLQFDIVEQFGEKLPFSNNYFDIVYARQVLHHAHNLDDLCKELSRVLKPGGIFLACREHVINTKSDLDIFLDAHSAHAYTKTECAYLLKEYTNALTEAGLTDLKIFGPWESNINLFPNDSSHIKQKLAKKIHLPIVSLIPDMLAFGIARCLRKKLYHPGCLYSFYGTKKQC